MCKKSIPLADGEDQRGELEKLVALADAYFEATVQGVVVTESLNNKDVLRRGDT